MASKVLLAGMLIAGSEAFIVPAGSCAATLCEEGNVCIEDKDGQARCIENPCNFVDCPPSSSKCVVTNDGLAECVSPVVGCAATLCKTGMICEEDITGQAHCVFPPTGCDALICLQGKICIEDDFGEATCVFPDCKTDCGLSVAHGFSGKGDGKNYCNDCSCSFDGKYSCTEKACPPNKKAEKCFPSCANVKCPGGTTCVVNRRGRPSCKADCETTCGNTVPHGWKGRDDGDNCCDKCKCRDGHMKCRTLRKKKCSDKCEECGFNCRTREVWSDKKREWCCKNQGMGCPPSDSLALGDVCYQFCEDGSCFVDKRDQCGKGVCARVPGIRLDSLSTCQLPVGSTCYRFCADNSCATIAAGEHCVTGTECRKPSEGNDYTCQEVLTVGEVCYQFCENPKECEFINRREQCPKGTECKSTNPGVIGWNSHQTCQEVLAVGDVCYQFCENSSECEFISRREQCPKGTECKSTNPGVIGWNSHQTCQEVLAVGDVCYQFCENSSECEFISRREQCPQGTECKPSNPDAIGWNSHETCQVNEVILS
eukprot:TRINITY_DN1834_c0_g1_i5.p1 TRINITY_DN1834_c0_g1~~TRINITY_DN1834_c0_g1_i5.p1  ORF type:complete len:540 (+),score=134.25 TRINITY_DN1834_c0_g1_i5:78-1697(+)